MSELPKGWATAPLNSICDKLRGVSYSRGEASPTHVAGTIPILRANNIKDDYLQFEDLVWVQKNRVSDKQFLKKGDIVVAMSSGSKKVVGKTAQLTEGWEGSFGAFCGVLRPHLHLENRYLGLYLRTREYRETISDLAAGSNINNLKDEHFGKIIVSVAPLLEQRRIVKKLEDLLWKVDSCRQRLDKIPVLFKRFRQSVLAAACSGRLTADWREANLEKVDAGNLSSKIRSAHEEIGGHCLGNAAPPTEDVHDLTLEMFPAGWRLLNLRDLVLPGRPITYGILKPGPEFENGVPYVRVADYPNDQLRLSTIRKTSPSIDQEFKRSHLIAGDILLSIRGTVGRLVVIPPELEGANITQDSARLSIQSAVNRDYVLWYLRSELAQSRMKGAIKGVAVRGINIGDVRALQVALPSFAEQHEIVRRIEALFEVADQIGARYAKANGFVDQLTQSILAKAFRGELVSTEAELAAKDGRDYEPASVLLERIQEDRKQLKPAKRGRGGKNMETRKTGRHPGRTRRPLVDVLREQDQPLTPERLFDLAGFDEDSVDGFYEQLRMLIQNGIIREDRQNKKNVYLEAVGA